MDTGTIIAIIVVAVVAVLVIAGLVMFMKRKRTNELRERYGAEYDRTVKSRGRKQGEQELLGREKRVSSLELHDLQESQRQAFMDRWTGVQGTFVEAPRTALQHADVLVQEVMSARGYPISDFEQRAADISVDHSELVSNYRSAHSISQRANSATTEEMRQAMLNYKELFAELLGKRESAAA